MFKVRNKLLIVSYIGIGLLATNIQYSFGNFLPVDAGLQKLGDLTSSSSVTKIDKSASMGDIFLSVYDNSSVSAERSSLLSAVNDVKEDILQQNPSQCQITSNDILVILMQKKEFKQDMYNNTDTPLSTNLTVQGSVQESCNKVLYCYGADKDYSIDSRKEIDNCENIVYSSYALKKELGTMYLSQPGTNHNDSIYIDGNSNNAPFDLLIDIQDIRAILFQDTNPPQAPEMIYYTMPNINTPTSTEEDAIPGSIRAFGIGGIIGDIIPFSNNPLSTINKTVPGNPNTPGSGLNNTSSPIDDFVQSLNKTTQTSPTKNNASTIQAPLCPIPDIEQIVIPEASDINTSPIDQFTQVQGQLFESLSGLLFQAPSPNDFTSLDNIPNTIDGLSNSVDNRIITDDPSEESKQCSASCEDKTNQVEKQICEGNCCISACNTISNVSKKAICISQCLCGEVATKNDELRIKFCRVPAQVSRVIANKKISNIEQAIDAINGIFRYLKNNGLMTKRTKTKELLDSSFSDIKFSQILSFDIFVAFKPLYDKISFSSLKENKKKENSNIQQAIHPLGVKRGDLQDRSKYIVLGDHAKTQAQKNIYSSFNEFADNVRDMSKMYCQQQGKVRKEDPIGPGECADDNSSSQSTPLLPTKTQQQLLSTSLTNNTIAQHNDSIYKFIDENYMFWEQISKSIHDMLNTSISLRNKAEQAQ